MALKQSDIRKAVIEAGSKTGTSPYMKNMALQEVLPILIAIVEDMGWFRRIFVGLRTLIKVLREYLGD